MADNLTFSNQPSPPAHVCVCVTDLAAILKTPGRTKCEGNMHGIPTQYMSMCSWTVLSTRLLVHKAEGMTGLLVVLTSRCNCWMSAAARDADWTRDSRLAIRLPSRSSCSRGVTCKQPCLVRSPPGSRSCHRNDAPTGRLVHIRSSEVSPSKACTHGRHHEHQSSLMTLEREIMN